MTLLRALLAVALAGGCQTLPTPMPADIPGAPDAGPASPTGPETFVIDALFFGESDAYSGGSSEWDRTWVNYGFDLDGLITTGTSTNVCTPQGKGRMQQIDGFMGIDNTFGALLPTLYGLGPTPSYDTTQAIRDGQVGIMIQTDGLTAGSADATGIHAQVFVGGTFGVGAPPLDVTTDWPVLASSLQDHATLASGALVQYSNAYVTGGRFVSGTPSNQPLLIPFTPFGADLFLDIPGSAVGVLRIHHAVISFVRSASAPRTLVEGTIAGVLDPTELALSLVATFGYATTMEQCVTDAQLYLSTLSPAVDILSDGTNRPGVMCDSISIGLGFRATQIANPTQVTTTDGTANPCDGP